MAFTPDHRTRVRNSHLQRKLADTCETLEKERRLFKKKYEDKQRECLSVYTRLNKDLAHYGVESKPHPVLRPATVSILNGLREGRSNSFSIRDNVHNDGPRRRAYSQGHKTSQQEGYVNDMKVYTFERLTTNSPDTQAYTVYCHNKSRRESMGTPVSKLSALVPQAFPNYNSAVNWKDVTNISSYMYMNRSQKRETLIDFRTPFVLADVKPHPPTRSISYSGPSGGLTKISVGRHRAATVGSSHLLSRPSRFNADETKNDTPAQAFSYRKLVLCGERSQTTDQPAAGGPTFQIDLHSSDNSAGERDEGDLDGVCVKNDETTMKLSDPLPTVNTDITTQKSADEVKHLLNLPQTATAKTRRTSAPEIKMFDADRTARSSHEARMQRRLSHAKPLTKWSILEDDDSATSSSESEQFNLDDFDSTSYVQKQVDSFVSGLKYSDVLEDHVSSYLSSVNKSKGPSPNKETHVSSVEKTNVPVQTPMKVPVLDISVTSKVDNSKHQNKPRKMSKTTPSVSNNQLLGLLRKPQIQLQALLNKIKDANRAAVRADRLKPTVKPKSK